MNLIPILTSNLASSNGPVRLLSHEILSLFKDTLNDKNLCVVLTQFTKIIQFGGGTGNSASNSPKVKSIIIEKSIGK